MIIKVPTKTEDTLLKMKDCFKVLFCDNELIRNEKIEITEEE